MAVFKPVRALERGLTVLQTINETDGCKTQELAEITGLARPTVFRLLETLERQGFVTQSPSAGGWHATLECNLLSSGYVHKSWVGQIAVPEMLALNKEVLWPLDLVTNHGEFMQVRESTHKFSPFSFDVGMVGKLLPILGTAGGHTYLAFCPDDERDLILDILRRSDLPENALAQDPRMMKLILERTRENGFGIRTEGYKSHTQSISVPVFQGERIIASLTIICLKTAMSFDKMVRRYSGPLRKTCKKIGDQINQSLSSDGEVFTL